MKVSGSARGAQVGGATWGAAVSVLALGSTWDSLFAWLGVVVCLFCASMTVRSFFLGVWIGHGEVTVVTWYSRWRFRAGDVEAVELQLYMGMGGFGVGFIPFAGNVRMIEVVLNGGRRVSLPSTLGRFDRVLKLTQQMRSEFGLRPKGQSQG
jgi:hypothetical protein